MDSVTLATRLALRLLPGRHGRLREEEYAAISLLSSRVEVGTVVESRARSNAQCGGVSPIVTSSRKKVALERAFAIYTAKLNFQAKK